MSVQCNQYLAWGYMLDFKKAREVLIELNGGEEGYAELADKYSDNAFKPDIVEVYGCSMIEDGMAGEYTFFGKIFAKSENDVPLSTMSMPEVTERDRIITEHEFKRVFGEMFNSDNPQYYLITHYR